MADRKERVVFRGRLGPPETASLTTVKCRAVPEIAGSAAGADQVAKVSWLSL